MMDPASLIRNGYAVIPLIPGKKAPPLVEDWETLRPETAIKAWERAPVGVNVGVVMADIVCALDFDNHGEHPNGADVFELLMREQSGIFSDSIIERTPSGGYHVSFRGMPDEKTYARFVIDSRTIDIEVLRGRRYSVVPPSRTQDGEYVYASRRTHENTPAHNLPELPETVVAAIVRFETETAAKRVKPLPGAGPMMLNDSLDSQDMEVCAQALLESYLAGATEGHRHNHALAYACCLFNIGLGEGEVRRHLHEFVRRIDRDMPDAEIEGILRYAPLYKSSPCIPWKTVWSDRRKRVFQKKMELIRGGSLAR